MYFSASLALCKIILRANLFFVCIRISAPLSPGNKKQRLAIIEVGKLPT